MPNTDNYPLFLIPEEIAAQSLRETTPKEAQIYFDWLLANLDHRIQGLLNFVNEHLTGDTVEDLTRIGEKVATALRLPEFSYRENAKPQLTNAGYALAADMGLLTAKLLLAACPSTVHWDWVKKPKNHLDYHQPVLVGFGIHKLNLIGGSIAEAYGILRGNKSSDIWKRTYLSWKAKAEKASIS